MFQSRLCQHIYEQMTGHWVVTLEWESRRVYEPHLKKAAKENYALVLDLCVTELSGQRGNQAEKYHQNKLEPKEEGGNEISLKISKINKGG